MKKLFILLALTAHLAAQAQSEGFRTFSLKQAIEYGVQNNISAKNAKLGEREAKARNHELLSMGLPQINGNFDYTYYIIKPTSPAFSASFDVSSLSNLPPPFDGLASAFPKKFYIALHNNIGTGVNLTQMVYDTRFFIGIQTFKKLIQVSQLQTALTEQDVRYNIIKGYSQTQSAKEILRYLDSSMVILNKLMVDTRATYQAGLIEENDVDRLELGVSNLQSQINNTKNLYELSLASLKYNMGLHLTDNIALTDDINSLRSQMNEVMPDNFDPAQRVENELLQAAMELKNFDRKQKKAGYYPSLTALANLGAGAQTDRFSNIGHIDSRTWYSQSYVGFTLRVPIYDGGQKEASVKQAKIELEKAKNDLENFQTQSTLQVNAAKVTFGNNLGEEQNAKRSMTLNNKIFGKTQIKFKEGVSSSFELIQTQQDQTTNMIRYYNAVRSVLESRADLDKALGIK
ncbi:MAG: TolC family protein [Bacteroidetes bacterium]|nr:TolC family protein [Bacteroidota bacterium]MBS1686429.1 TolC family protein [Bacteroidota bacterium]